MTERWPLFWIAVVGLSQICYVVTTMSDLRHPAWQPDSPLHIELWNGFRAGHPSLTAECDPERSIRAALDTWAAASSLELSFKPGSSFSEARRDGHNLITIADTPSNRNFLGTTPLAQTKYWQIGSAITESDIVINPSYTWSSEESAGGWSLQRVAMHELGHAFGLAHSIDRSDTMHFQGGYFVHGYDRLAWDDIAAINTNYPMPGIDLISGAITGRVRMEGAPVFGAFVVAVDEDGVVAASALSLPDGSYRIDRLPPGKYTLYVEPLDGPMTPSQIYMGLSTATINTSFRPQFYRNSMLPLVAVKATERATADFNLASARSNLDPEWTRIDTDPNQSGLFTPLTVVAHSAEEQHVAVAGTGVASISDQSGVFFLGPHLATGVVSRTHRNESGLDFKWFPLLVSQSAPNGPYSIFVRNNTELGVLTGALQVDSQFDRRNGFAHFVHLPGQAASRIVLINTSTRNAVQGRLLSLDQSGANESLTMLDASEPLTTGTDFGLPAGGSLLATSSGDRPFQGSFRSDASASLSGYVLIDTSHGSASFLASQPTHYFVAPLSIVAGGKGSDTGLALTNFEKRPVQILLQVRDGAGKPRSSATLELPGDGQLARYISEMAPDLPPNFNGTLAVTANRLVGATVIQTGETGFTTFPVLVNRTARRLFFAQFAHGAAIDSELILVNPSPRQTAESVEVIIHSGGAAVELNGQRLTEGRKTLSVPPLGLAKLKTTGGGTWSGYLELNSDLPVGGLTLFRSPQFGTAGVGESVPMDRMVLPLLRRLGVGEDTGIALVNSESRSVRISVTARDQDGTAVSTASFTLDAAQQLARFTDDSPMHLGLDANFQGSLWIEADGRVAATVMLLSRNGLATLAASPAFGP